MNFWVYLAFFLLSGALVFALVLLHKTHQQSAETKFGSSEPESSITVLITALLGWLGLASLVLEVLNERKKTLAGKGYKSIWCRLEIHDWRSEPHFTVSDANGTPFAQAEMRCCRPNCYATKHGAHAWLAERHGYDAQNMDNLLWLAYLAGARSTDPDAPEPSIEEVRRAVYA